MTILYPMFVLVLLTAVVGLSTAYVRISSAAKGKIDPRYYKLMSKYDAPDAVIKFGRNFDNLFEVPVLFYTVGVCALVLKFESSAFLVLAWAFVALRVIHSWIHLTYNHPLHRFVPFLLSFLVVIAMWALLVFQGL